MSLECVRVLEAFLACLASEESFVGVNSFNVGLKSIFGAERFRALIASIPVAVFHMAFEPLSIIKCYATQLTFVFCWILHEELFRRIASTDGGPNPETGNGENSLNKWHQTSHRL